MGGAEILPMMEPKKWWAMFALYMVYLFLGTIVFYYNEHQLETERRAVALAERIEINGEPLPL